MNAVKLKGIYCESLTRYQRFRTRPVFVGDLILGGDNPIRVQSMTTTDTMNTPATVEQSIRMIEAGSELVRITAPSINEARNLEVIKNELHKSGFNTPIVADIHFTPNAAEMAARLVEKVRVNPGNYADRKKFETIDYSDASYDAELERIRQRFTPLIKICKEYGTALRIGTNHGSLSDRIMSRYGDTPLGMVESAMEFLRICEDNSFYNTVLSMKSSNPQVMVQAYRLLVVKMLEAGMNYPLHLGVTEAGEGEDGRIKSAEGIGSLLEDGLGDTIRVSLTEDPEKEIPVALALVTRYNLRNKLQKEIPDIDPDALPYSPFEYTRRDSIKVLNTGAHEVPRVIADFSSLKEIVPSTLSAAGYIYNDKTDKWNIGDQACDLIYTGSIILEFEIPGTLSVIIDAAAWDDSKVRHYPLFDFESYKTSPSKSQHLNFLKLDAAEIARGGIKKAILTTNTVIVLFSNNDHAMAELRRAFITLMQDNISLPVIINRNYTRVSPTDTVLNASTDVGALLLDGFGDGVWLNSENLSPALLNTLSFGILQASRTRISKTEYISCPSCGRTLFDLQETTLRIRTRTDHLKGIKIGIMGCIVNGPGEMADADYGYVGTGPGKITLYKGKEVVRRNIESDKAVDELIELIKTHGDWVERETGNVN
jgi:(E)-4-hydroxy-3-methylbut-2-enyl-diphosphate synthase